MVHAHRGGASTEQPGDAAGIRGLPRRAESGALEQSSDRPAAANDDHRRIPARRGDVVIGIDDTIERRWGAKIKARGIYRDPVRSTHATSSRRAASGAHGLGADPVGGRRWALPFLPVLAPSERWSAANGRWRRWRRWHKKVDRSGASGDSAGETLTTRLTDHRGCRFELRRPRCHRCGSPPTCSRRLRRAAAASAAAGARRDRGCRGSSNSSPSARRRGRPSSSIGMAANDAGSTSPPKRPCGITPAYRRRRSDGARARAPSGNPKRP